LAEPDAYAAVHSQARRPWRAFIAALAAGAIIRAAALPFPGTGDVLIWKTWAVNAAATGPSRLYGVGAGAAAPREYHLLHFGEFEAIADYPPLALDELGAAAWLYGRATGTDIRDGRTLTVVIKALPVAFEVMLVALLFVAIRKIAGDAAARWAAVAYWLNPAALISASFGGYLDALFVLPAVASLVAATSGWAALAGGLAVASVLTKPQGIFIVPAVVIAAWNAPERPRRSVMTALAAGAAAGAGIVVAPVVAAGAWWNMVHGVASQGNEIYLSMEGYNFWWAAGHGLWTAYAWQRGLAVWPVLIGPVARIPFTRAAAHGLPFLRVAGATMAVAAVAWGAWVGRRARDLSLVAALGAFCVHAFAVLGPQVHENHLFAAMPLLVVASAERKRYVPMLIAVSVFLSLSMVFYIFSDEERRFVLSRSLTVIDTTLLLALFNCALLLWHAAVLRKEARS
jgi:hypothetical protein